MQRAIVLSGGGARGSYQIGVWMGLKKLHIKYDIVTGTSVGSLNGALMTQKSFLRGIWFWYNIKFGNIFDEQFTDDYKTKSGRSAIAKKYAEAILFNNGMDAKNLEGAIDRVINEDKIRKSKIKFGLVTFNLSNFKPLLITKDDIPYGKLKDYLMASSTCFPAFKKKDIDGKLYIDGGYYDNLPINLAIDMGATEIIAVDLRSVGFRRRIKNCDVKIKYIRPRNDLGSFLIFHKDLARRGMRLGYNDTLKAFNKLDGNIYTFKYNNLYNNFNKYGLTFTNTISNLFKNKSNSILTQLFRLTTYKENISEKEFNNIIEFLGKVFEIDDSHIYSINKFNTILSLRLLETPLIKRRDLNKFSNSRLVVKYIYDLIDADNKKELSGMALLFSKELLGAIYLYIISTK